MSFVGDEKVVKTRKRHQCHGCLDYIEVGEKAFYQSGHNGDCWYRLYMHTDCNDLVNKHIDFLDPWGDGLRKGVLLDL